MSGLQRWGIIAALVVLAACGQSAGGDSAEPASARRPDPTSAPRPDPSSARRPDPHEAGAAADAPAGSTPTADRSDTAGPSVSVEVTPLDGWERTDEPDLLATGHGEGDVYLHDAACHDGFCAHLHVVVLPGPVDSLEAYHGRSKREVERVLDAEVLSEERATVDGYDGYQLTYRVDDAGGTLRYLQRYALVEGQVVVATFTATPRLLEQWRDDADALLESITVTLEG